VITDVVYMDNNATTRVAPEVVEAMIPYLRDYYGNPSSMYSFGGQVGGAVVRAREQVAALLGANPDEILFTSCGTESDNTAIRSALRVRPGKRHIVTTRVEHPAVLSLCKNLEKEGYVVTYLSVNSRGWIDLDELRHAIREDTAVVSIMYANNETGTIFPIEEAGAIVKGRGVLFHVDAVQATGKIPLDMAKSHIDMLALSGHKIHAPKGVGALYVRRGTPFRAFLIGGHQEKSRRGGTENVGSLVALGAAAEIAMGNIKHENTVVRAMRDRLQAGLMSAAPDARLNGHPVHRLPNTANISFEYVEGEAILLLLNQFRICASSGSACTSGSLEPSHVLRAMGVPYTAAHGSVRFSLSRYNTDDEVDYVLEKLPPVIRRLREISPFGRDGGSQGPQGTKPDYA
jgi:cysteine desulfurase